MGGPSYDFHNLVGPIAGEYVKGFGHVGCPFSRPLCRAVSKSVCRLFRECSLGEGMRPVEEPQRVRALHSAAWTVPQMGDPLDQIRAGSGEQGVTPHVFVFELPELQLHILVIMR